MFSNSAVVSSRDVEMVTYINFMIKVLNLVCTKHLVSTCNCKQMHCQYLSASWLSLQAKVAETEITTFKIVCDI